jgi:hypothetical protein
MFFSRSAKQDHPIATATGVALIASAAGARLFKLVVRRAGRAPAIA